jgi:hypothetical protein
MNGNGMVKDLERTSARWPAAAAAKVDTFVRRRVGAAAEVQSRRVLAGAQAELGNRALRRFFELLYDETATGRLCNLGDGGRILIAAPWSRTRHAAYGLTDHGGRVLRACLMAQLQALPTFASPLFLAGGRWHVNLRKYADLAPALAWLDKWPISADAWLRANDSLPRRGGRD